MTAHSPVSPALELLMRLKITVGAPQLVGESVLGSRKIIPILGGSFNGASEKYEKLVGDILPGGGDWLVIKPDGCAVIDARFTLQTSTRALIYVQDQGLRFGPIDIMQQLAANESVDPQQYYFRTTTRFETGDKEFAWLNRVLAVGSGMRDTSGVTMDFYRIV